jgi:hypothetical protein
MFHSLVEIHLILISKIDFLLQTNDSLSVEDRILLRDICDVFSDIGDNIELRS